MHIFTRKIENLPNKQQLKWCEILQNLQTLIDWKKVYKNNYFSTIKTKLRSFQIKLNLRSLVMNVHLVGFGTVIMELCFFCFEQPETNYFIAKRNKSLDKRYKK